jgi:hypothetical protein
MNKENRQVEMLFDRLVDGELNEVERRQLLASLEERPDGWRRCALAFLEAQSWRGDLAQLVRPMSPPPEGELSPHLPARRNLFSQSAAWLAIAASLVIAFTFGLMQRDDGPRHAAVSPKTEDQLVAVEPPQQQTAVPVDDALTLWVRDDTGQTRPLRVPLVDAGDLDRKLGVSFQSALPPAVRERLQRRGYDVQSKRRYAPLWLENGRSMIVPVEDTKIVPVGQNVY